MSEEQTNSIRVAVEMADDFEPGERTTAALVALVDALHSEHGDDDVAGFSGGESRNFSFLSFGVPRGDATQWKVTVDNTQFGDVTLKRTT